MPQQKGAGRTSDNTAFKRGKNHLLVIAIDAYEHCNRLQNCVKDAQDLIQVLTERYAFEEENIIRLFDSDATKQSIDEAFDELEQRVKPQDNLLIYFSGHGYYRRKTGYLIPVGGKTSEPWNFFPNSELLNCIRVIDAFHTFLMVDSCFSGSLFSTTKNVDSSAFSEKAERQKSRWALAAGAIEKVDDGFHGDNSPFAKAVLAFLKANTEPKFPVSKLIQEVKVIVAHNSDQRPIGGHLFKVGDEDGEFVFHLQQTHTEASAWQQAQQLDTIEAYDDFLDEYSNGTYRTDAKKRIEELQDEREWQRAGYLNTRSAYADYLDHIRYFRYHIGKYTEQAKQRRQELKQSRTARQKSPSAEKPKPTSKLIEMVFVEGGTFKMGSNEYDTEKPIHDVTVKDFWLGKYPVTLWQFQAFINATHYQTDADKKGSSYIWTGKEWKEQKGVNWKCGIGGELRSVQQEQHPVIHVSWNDATAFCKWLSEKENLNYRIPSEAEWEFAARGGKKSKGFKYAGSNNLDEIGWYRENSGMQTHAVGEKQPNELGIYDMSGNVWEWCQDVGHGNYKGAPHDGSAWLTGGKQIHRVVRGGSWINYDNNCRVSNRYLNADDYRDNDLGLRLCQC